MAKNTKHKHTKHQKEVAAGERIIHITHVLNKYSGIEVLSTFKLGLFFWISNVSVINNFRQWLVWAIISVLSKSILWSGLSVKCLDTSTVAKLISCRNAQQTSFRLCCINAIFYNFGKLKRMTLQNFLQIKKHNVRLSKKWKLAFSC